MRKLFACLLTLGLFVAGCGKPADNPPDDVKDVEQGDLELDIDTGEETTAEDAVGGEDADTKAKDSSDSTSGDS